MRRATESYREESDILAEFLSARVVWSPTATVAKGALYEAYRTWCEGAKEAPIGKRTFGERITERGILDARGNGGVKTWLGIGLLSDFSDLTTENPVLRRMHDFSCSNTENQVTKVTKVTNDDLADSLFDNIPVGRITI